MWNAPFFIVCGATTQGGARLLAHSTPRNVPVRGATTSTHADAAGLQIQREALKAGRHMLNLAEGSERVNILRHESQGRGDTAVGKLSAIVLIDPAPWVLPVPPPNPVLKLV